MIRQITKLAWSLIGRGRIKSVNDSGPVQTMQVQLGNEIHDNLPRLADFGFNSLPPVDTDVCVLFIGGDRSNGVAISTGHQSTRKKNLFPGESALYDSIGKFIHLTKDGIIIDAANQFVTVNNATTVTVNASSTVTVNTPADVVVNSDTSTINATTSATVNSDTVVVNSDTSTINATSYAAVNSDVIVVNAQTMATINAPTITATAGTLNANAGTLNVTATVAAAVSAPAVSVTSSSMATITAPSVTFNVTNFQVNGQITCTGQIFDWSGVHGSLNNIRTQFNLHHHSGVTVGASKTGISDIIIP